MSQRSERDRKETSPLAGWEPRTKLGRAVYEGEITSIEEIFKRGLKIKEWQIVDVLLPDLEEEVLDVMLVQKMTDAGRKRKFKATVVVGNKDGYVGLGEAKHNDVGPTIRLAIQNAKLNISPVRRGCGSWECGCGEPHTVPFKVRGKSGSPVVELLPAPKGLGLVAGDVAKLVLELAGIKDVWSKTYGQTRTTHNFAKATFHALQNTYSLVHTTDWAR